MGQWKKVITSTTFVKNEFAPVSYTILEAMHKILNSEVHFNWNIIMHVHCTYVHVTFDWP